MRMLYKYPQAAYPYEWLVEENARRGKLDREFELHDTGVFANGAYFDVIVEYAKADADDVLMRITVHTARPRPPRLHLIPQLWARNVWSWSPGHERARIARQTDGGLLAHRISRTTCVWMRMAATRSCSARTRRM